MNKHTINIVKTTLIIGTTVYAYRKASRAVQALPTKIANKISNTIKEILDGPYDTYIYKSKKDAEEMIDTLLDIYDSFGVVTFKNYRDALGEPTKNYDLIWDIDISKPMIIETVSNGYELKLQYIKNYARVYNKDTRRASHYER